MKVEAKGSLWKVHCSDGAYSSRTEEVFVVSANSADEAKLVFKKALQEKVIVYGSCMMGAIFEDGERFQFVETPKYKSDGEINWNTNSFGDAFDVSITRLEVIYM